VSEIESRENTTMPQATAFGSAMMDGINKILDNLNLQPHELYSLDVLRRRDLNFGINYTLSVNQHTVSMPISDFIGIPERDYNSLTQLNISENSRVADLGCGIGRHLLVIRDRYPKVECYGVEHCSLQSAFLRNYFPEPKTIVQNLAEAQGDFDAIFMLGNGLGILGDENGIISGLREWGKRIKPEGYFAIETGTMGGDIDRVIISSTYNNIVDPPFAWYGFSARRLRSVLENPNEDGTSYDVTITPTKGPFFLAIARKRMP